MKEAEQHELVRDRFTKTAENFSTFVLNQRVEEANRLAELATEGADARGWRALDLACGPGTFARAMAGRVRFVAGLDLTPAMLARARKAVGEVTPACAFACGDAGRMPFRDGVFDAATCGFALHHMQNIRHILGEISRILRTGGRAAIRDIIVPEGASSEANTRIEKTRDPSHTRCLGVAELRELLTAAGLRVRKEELSARPRDFDSWMHVVNAEPGSAMYKAVRELLEATMENDAAGMRPRRKENGGLEFSVTTLCIVGEKQ
ncbi:MAG TPA: methyltransferase domain-containing protein [Candidatus Acidoferrum sp.]|nr:methyltransferase domain-containing protein [Candidatus Acidoferrum sp.]